MKKCILLFLGLCVTFMVASSFLTTYVGQGESYKKDIADKLIRFHVLANSDSEEDQNLKLKVRDRVLEYISPILEEVDTVDDSRKILNENNDKIIAITEAVIAENGYEYSVSSGLGYENFPVKSYGNITLPSGEYEAYRILIGNAEGRNWWCVMFPPLCFVDVTKGDVSNIETEKKMRTVLSDDEFNSVDNTKNNINFKFKIVEIINEVFK